MKFVTLAATALLLASGLNARKKDKVHTPAPLDQYVTDALQRGDLAEPSSPGSLWSPSSRLADVARDLRASQVDDLLTIVVTENASAVANGTTKTARASAAKNSITALAGPTKVAGRLADLTSLSGSSSLNGQGTTTRSATLSATLSARVVQTLPNGYLVIEGTKNVVVNSEHQLITVRGVVRPADITTNNQVNSSRIAELEVNISGKGVINDSVRRPMFLYRILLGLLPF